MLDIKIISADGEDTIRTTDPEFFTSRNMIPKIHSVSIAYNYYDAPVACSVELSVIPPDGRASLSVDGTNSEVVLNIYHELERELRSHQVLGGKIAQVADNLLFIYFLVGIIGLAIYSIFDLSIDLLGKWVDNFIGSSVHQGIQIIGWFSLIAGSIAGTFFINKQIKRSFPVVEFTGRLTDVSTVDRKRLLWIFTTILLPIIVNVISNLITEGLK